MTNVDFRQLSENYARLGAAAARLDAAENTVKVERAAVRDAVNAAKSIPGAEDSFIEGIIGRPLSDLSA
jgi:hypothetical protein